MLISPVHYRLALQPYCITPAEITAIDTLSIYVLSDTALELGVLFGEFMRPFLAGCSLVQQDKDALSSVVRSARLARCPAAQIPPPAKTNSTANRDQTRTHLRRRL